MSGDSAWKKSLIKGGEMKSKIFKTVEACILFIATVTLLGLLPPDETQAWTLVGDSSIDGYLGIGTESPNYELHIHNPAATGYKGIWMQFSNNLTGTGPLDGFYLGIESDSTAQLWSETGMPIIIVPGGSYSQSNRTFFNADGNVGIGTKNPSSKLTVTGTIESTGGGIKFPDGTVQSTAAAAPIYAGVAVVAQSGGDYTSPADAMNDLAAWCLGYIR